MNPKDGDRNRVISNEVRNLRRLYFLSGGWGRVLFPLSFNVGDHSQRQLRVIPHPVVVYNIPGCDLEETYLSLYLVCMVIRYGEKWVNFVGHWFFETVRNVKPTSPVPSPCTWYIRHKACIYDDRVKGTCSISHQQYTLV